MKTLILHIGAHKTGTTYIQKVFYDSHKQLLKDGVLYPLRWTQNLWGHHELIQIIKQGEVDKVSEFLTSSFEKTDTILLSTENFEDLPVNAIQRLKAALDPSYQIVIVYFVRRLTKILPSQWQENVKHGSFQTFPEYLLSHLNAPFNSTALNYSLKINNWATVFGSDAISLVSYDNLTNDKQDIADYFVSAVLKKSTILVKAEKTINVSLNVELIELIRVLNYLYFLDSGTQSLHPRYYLTKLIELGEVNVDYIQLKLKNNRATIDLADESYIFKQLNNYLFQQYGGNFLNIVDSKIFTNTRLEPVQYINSTAISSTKINFEIYELYQVVKDYLDKTKLLKDIQQ